MLHEPVHLLVFLLLTAILPLTVYTCLAVTALYIHLRESFIDVSIERQQLPIQTCGETWCNLASHLEPISGQNKPRNLESPDNFGPYCDRWVGLQNYWFDI